MLFSSLEFLFFFLPITLAVYYLLPFKWGCKNAWLLLSSLFFYAWGEPSFVFVMLLSIAFNYSIAILIDAVREKNLCAKILMAGAIVGNVAVIGTWKYLNFITETLRTMFPGIQGVIPQTSFILPIGISFFTFQALSYVIDVYRGIPVQKNPFKVALYIALFPQLVAGPIVRYSTVMNAIDFRRTTLPMFSDGVLRFLIGFNKKMLLANTLGTIADFAFASQDLSVAMSWLGAVCYALQIFFDFSGYSDMAIGLGKMFGFEFLENFNYPYISKTCTEFWRRWHISLGSWFRDYLYFPLGGSRVGKMRMVLNLSVVWLATGVWHGANWTFILWGIGYGILIIGEKLLEIPRKVEEIWWWRVWYQPFTILMILLGWVLFRSVDISSALHYICVMFGFSGQPVMDGIFSFKFSNVVVLLCAASIFCLPTVPMLRAMMQEDRFGLSGGGYCIAEYTIHIALFFISISSLVMNSHNPFIYFNF